MDFDRTSLNLQGVTQHHFQGIYSRALDSRSHNERSEHDRHFLFNTNVDTIVGTTVADSLGFLSA